MIIEYRGAHITRDGLNINTEIIGEDSEKLQHLKQK